MGERRERGGGGGGYVQQRSSDKLRHNYPIPKQSITFILLVIPSYEYRFNLYSI